MCVMCVEKTTLQRFRNAISMERLSVVTSSAIMASMTWDAPGLMRRTTLQPAGLHVANTRAMTLGSNVVQESTRKAFLTAVGGRRTLDWLSEGGATGGQHYFWLGRGKVGWYSESLLSSVRQDRLEIKGLGGLKRHRRFFERAQKGRPVAAQPGLQRTWPPRPRPGSKPSCFP